MVKKGYEPSEVNEFIASLEGIIKSYKDKDAAIKNAILNAQIAADNIIQNARKEAEETRRGVADYVDTLIASVSHQKDTVNSFLREYTQFFEKYLVRVDSDDFTRINEKINALEGYLLKHSSDQFQDFD